MKSGGLFTKYPLGIGVGTFQKNPAFAWWVFAGQIVSKSTMNSHYTHWVNAPLPPVIRRHHCTIRWKCCDANVFHQKTPPHLMTSWRMNVPQPKETISLGLQINPGTVVTWFTVGYGVKTLVRAWGNFLASNCLIRQSPWRSLYTARLFVPEARSWGEDIWSKARVGLERS